jgi:hypothetical protein
VKVKNKPCVVCTIIMRLIFLEMFLSRTKKTVIVDVVLVNSVMWAEGWEKGSAGARVMGGAVVT